MSQQLHAGCWALAPTLDGDTYHSLSLFTSLCSVVLTIRYWPRLRLVLAVVSVSQRSLVLAVGLTIAAPASGGDTPKMTYVIAATVKLM